MDSLFPIPGIRLSTVCAGIKQTGRRDLVAMELGHHSRIAAVFTQNRFCAAPVQVAKRHLQAATPRYLLVNTGNANAGTGQKGLEDALACCEALAQAGACQANQVLPFSTGVIGENLPMDTMTRAIPNLIQGFSETAWEDAAHGIMTTDTVAKARSRQFKISDKTVTITGMAKGSGMIRPDMATMLAYIATDAAIEHEELQYCLDQAVKCSFNRITVDGDTSTNDACVLIASAEGAQLKAKDALETFQMELTGLCQDLAKDMVRDAEGATKLVTVKVYGGSSEQDCELVAYTVAQSPLVKTALFASDPNWGRILAAVGRSGVDFDLERIEIFLDDVRIVTQGGRDSAYTEEAGQAVMQKDEIVISINLNQGAHQTIVWTCDFSYDYVKINAEYRT